MSGNTESQNILALDIGYSATKMSYKTINDFSEKGLYRELQSIDVISIPGGIAPLGEIDTGLDSGSYPTVIVDGQRYDTGLNHSVVSTPRHMTNSFTEKVEWMARFKSAIKTAGFENGIIDKLVLGLPTDNYYDTANPSSDSYYVELLKKNCSGEILIDLDAVNGIEQYVTVREVVVIPQPQGTYLGMVSMADNADLRQLARKHRIMVLDVGYCTFDWIVMDGLKVRTDLSGSVTTSYSHVLKGAASELDNQIAGENLKRKYTFQPDDIEAAAFDGDTTILGFGGRNFDITGPLDKHSRKVFSSALIKFEPSIDNNPVAAVILTGGGSTTFEPVVREWAEDTCGFKLFCPEQPALLNARGYMTKAIMG